MVLALAAGLSGALGAAPVRAQPDALNAGQLEALATSVLARSDRLAQIWPGYWPASQMFVIYESGVGAVFAGGARPMEFRPGRLENATRPFVFDYPSGVPNTIMIQRYQTPDRTLLTMFHELFHDVQTDRFAGTGRRGEFVDLSSVTDRVGLTVDMEIERRALSAALQADDPQARRAGLKTYLSLRRTREAGMPARVVATERSREVFEGTADYVGRRALDVALETNTSRRDILKELEDDLISGPGSYLNRWFRARSYGVGAALCLMLDEFGGDWKPAVEGGAALDDLLGRAIGEPSVAERSRLASLGREAFGAADVMREVTAAFASGPPQLAALSDFEALAGKRIIVRINEGAGPQPEVTFSAQMHPLSPSAIALLAVQSFHIESPTISITAAPKALLMDSEGSGSSSERVYTFVIDDLGGLSVPAGESRPDALHLTAEGVDIKVRGPVRIVRTDDAIVIFASQERTPAAP